MSNKRREVLKKIALSTAAIGVAGTTAGAQKVAKAIDNCNCDFPAKGPGAAYFTNAIVQTHDRGRLLFYNDLLAKRVVLVNFMSIRTEEEFKTTENLLKVQELLGSRLGKQFFINTISTDPINDTVSALQKWAKEHQTAPGWSFITGSPEIVEGLKQRFFYRDPSTPKHPHQHQDCSQGLMRYGNEKVGLWASVANASAPEWVVKRLEWISGGTTHTHKAIRKGPQVLVKGKPWLYDSGNYS